MLRTIPKNRVSEEESLNYIIMLGKSNFYLISIFSTPLKMFSCHS